MKHNFTTLVRTTRTSHIMLALLAVLGGLANAVAAHAQSTTTFGGSLHVVRGYQEAASDSAVVQLMKIPGLGSVTVNCPTSLTGIAFFPEVSGSLWFTHIGGTAYVNGSGGTQLSRQASDDVVTAQFATGTKTVTMIITGHPGATCIYSGQAVVQP